MNSNIEALRQALAEHVRFHDDGLGCTADSEEWQAACSPRTIARLLDALELAHKELDEIHQGLTNPGWFTNGPKAAHMHALNWSRKSAERRAAMKDKP